MFGNAHTPSRAFLLEAEIEGQWRPVIKLLGCRPKDTSSIPAEIVAKWPEYGDGCMDDACTKCGCEVVLGPRQAIAYDMAPEEYTVLCLVCATLAAILYGDGGEIDINHLGGE